MIRRAAANSDLGRAANHRHSVAMERECARRGGDDALLIVQVPCGGARALFTHLANTATVSLIGNEPCDIDTIADFAHVRTGAGGSD